MKHFGKRNISAFTLFEVILSIGLIASISVVSMPILQTLLFRNELRDATNQSFNALKSAQQMSQSGYLDSEWGVRFGNSMIIIYEGVDFDNRNTSQDIVYNVSTRVGFSGQNDITFSKIYGYPNLNGIINIIIDSSSNSLSINEKGKIDYL